MIFILCVEILAESIRQNVKIDGIRLEKSNIKICQYADDATVFLKNEQELNECIQMIKNFNNHSGMSLNMSKSEGLWIGRSKLRQKSCNIRNIKWPTSPIKYLGIYIGYNKEECIRLNWHNKIDKLKGILDTWKTKRILTLFGKQQVIKCLAMAGLIFTATNCELPSDKIVQDINKEIYGFLWGTTEKIRRSILINTTKEGGIGMLNVQSQFEALKAMWAIRILKNSSATPDHWTEIPMKYLDKLGKDFYVLNSHLNDKETFKSLSCIPLFYQQMVIAFSKSKSMENKDSTDRDILNDTIFGNTNVTYLHKRKCTIPYFVNWINSGIRFVKDLEIEHGKINTKYIYDKVSPKTNIHNEIAIMIKCLKPLIKDISNNPSDYQTSFKLGDIHTKKEITSKLLYTNLINHIKEKPYMEEFWNKTFNETIIFKEVYQKKINDIKDKKLTETNFKILHGILPC